MWSAGRDRYKFNNPTFKIRTFLASSVTLFGTESGTLSRRFLLPNASDAGKYLSNRLSSNLASRSLCPFCETAKEEGQIAIASKCIAGSQAGSRVMAGIACNGASAVIHQVVTKTGREC
jgi:hypothetical protein